MIADDPSTWVNCIRPRCRHWWRRRHVCNDWLNREQHLVLSRRCKACCTSPGVPS